jgi:hypothetical protein
MVLSLLGRARSVARHDFTKLKPWLYVASLLVLAPDLVQISVAHADEQHRVDYSQYEQVLINDGARETPGMHLRVNLDARYFPWVKATEGSEGLNFQVDRLTLSHIECADASKSSRLQGILGPRIADPKDVSSLARLAYAMTHNNWAFNSNPDLVGKFLSKTSDYYAGLQETERIVDFVVGSNGKDYLRFYRSQMPAVTLALCFEDTLGIGPRCRVVTTTDLATYHFDLHPSALEKTTQLGCLGAALNRLEADVRMHEEH